MEMHDTDLLLRTVIKEMDWSKADQEVVMDVGCGFGDSCRGMLLPALPNVKKMIGIDVMPAMIEHARKNNMHDKIEYHVADIEDRSTVEKWAAQISKIVSINYFDGVGDHREAFKNIYHILKPGGEAVLLFMLSTPFWDSFTEHVKNPSRNKYLKNVNPHIPESHYKKDGASQYRTLLEDIGFKIIVCKEEKRIYEECRVASYSRCGLTSHFPDELKGKGLKHWRRLGPDGRSIRHYTTLTLLIQKPNA